MKAFDYKTIFILLFVILVVTVYIVIVIKLTDSQVLLGIIGVVAAIMTASFQYRTTKDKEIEARLFPEKQAVYSELIHMVMGMIHARKESLSSEEQVRLVKDIQDIRTKLLIWGSADTIKVLDRMGEINLSSPRDLSIIIRMADLYSAIRKDLGHKDPKGESIEMAIGMLIPADRSRVRKELAEAESKPPS